jgi:hypothetical protein
MSDAPQPHTDPRDPPPRVVEEPIERDDDDDREDEDEALDEVRGERDWRWRDQPDARGVSPDRAGVPVLRHGLAVALRRQPTS